MRALPGDGIRPGIANLPPEGRRPIEHSPQAVAPGEPGDHAAISRETIDIVVRLGIELIAADIPADPLAGGLALSDGRPVAIELVTVNDPLAAIAHQGTPLRAIGKRLLGHRHGNPGIDRMHQVRPIAHRVILFPVPRLIDSPGKREPLIPARLPRMRDDLAQVLTHVFLVLFFCQPSPAQPRRPGADEKTTLPPVEEKLLHAGIGPLQDVPAVLHPPVETDGDEGRVYPVFEHIAEIFEEELPELIAVLLDPVEPGYFPAIEKAELDGESDVPLPGSRSIPSIQCPGCRALRLRPERSPCPRKPRAAGPPARPRLPRVAGAAAQARDPCAKT